ncbi:MarR family winged helix-turn-helix transcriptional regulator [Novosphingobium barchaimii]|nr:MarR family winged helix-turn-helix transcriptional regulator [Novosphingobium barchaimii]
MKDERMGQDHSDIVAAVGRELSALLVDFRATVNACAEAFDADLQPAAYQVAVLLSARGAAKAGALAGKLAMDKSAVSRLAKSLCGAGLAMATPDPADGRGVLYSLTEKGEAQIRAANLVKVDAYYARIEGWRDQDLAQFAHLLRKFNQV